MKKLAPAIVLALGLTFTVPSMVSAEQTCIDKVIGPVLQIPIEVCVDVPGIPEVPPLPDVPIIPPIVEPPIEVPPAPMPVPINPPAAPTAPAEPGPAQPAIPPAVVSPDAPVLDKPSPIIVHTPRDEAVTDFEELVFPLAVFLGLLTLLFGGSQLYKFLTARRTKRLDTEENVL